jgi:hypothetical protein
VATVVEQYLLVAMKRATDADRAPFTLTSLLKDYRAFVKARSRSEDEIPLQTFSKSIETLARLRVIVAVDGEGGGAAAAVVGGGMRVEFRRLRLCVDPRRVEAICGGFVEDVRLFAKAPLVSD